jgi:hypothetical protein
MGFAWTAYGISNNDGAVIRTEPLRWFKVRSVMERRIDLQKVLASKLFDDFSQSIEIDLGMMAPGTSLLISRIIHA